MPSSNSDPGQLKSVEVPEARDGSAPTDSVSSQAENEPRYLTPRETLQLAGKYLTLYEKKEILNYREIYCFGRKAVKEYAHPKNNGFDSENRSYRVVLRDHIAYRYEVLRSIGCGYSSRVYKVFDHKNRAVVALKCFRNDEKCRNLAEKERKILTFLNTRDVIGLGRDVSVKASPNIVRLLDHFVFRKHHFLVLEMLSENLLSYLKRTRGESFTPEELRAVAVSILHALLLLFQEKIIHGDLKPENFVFRTDGRTGIKLIDFGTACEESETVFSYFQTRFYRSPEILLNLNYGLPIDVWSCGCLFVELTTGTPLFPCRDEKELLAGMMEILGLPPAHMLESCRQAHPAVFEEHFNPDGTAKYCPTPTEYWVGSNLTEYRVGSNPTDHRVGSDPTDHRAGSNPTDHRVGSDPADVRSGFGPPGSRSLESVFYKNKNINPLFVDFIRRCLVFDPSRRMTPVEAVEHPWIRLTPRFRREDVDQNMS